MEKLRFVKNFRIDDLNFKLYKNKTGQYRTICIPEIGEQEEYVYEDFEELYQVVNSGEC